MMFDSPWEDLLHYGLLVGAAIQLIAIAAIVVLPSPNVEEEDRSDEVKNQNKNPRGAEDVTPSTSKKSNKLTRQEKERNEHTLSIPIHNIIF